MRTMKIVADSACDVFTLPNVAYACAPMKIITNEREFIDTAELNVEEMVEYLSHYKEKSKSSCPAPDDWLQAFGDANDIFCFTITGGLSGSYNSALSAAQIYMAENEDTRVFVFDSLSAGPEITLMVEKARDCILAQMEYEEICQTITRYQKQTGLLFMLKSLHNFANNGRVSPLVAKVCGLAGICIVGKASAEGTLSPDHKCRGEIRSLNTLLEDLQKAGFQGGKLSIGHCQNQNAAEKFKGMVLEQFPTATIEIHPLNGLCSFYAQLGGLLIGYEA